MAPHELYYFIFNQRKLVKKRREERENKANGGFNPFDDDDNDEDVRRLARKFEEKYVSKIIFF